MYISSAEAFIVIELDIGFDITSKTKNHFLINQKLCFVIYNHSFTNTQYLTISFTLNFISNNLLNKISEYYTII